MESISSHDIRTQIGPVLDRIMSGETVTITRWRRPVAVLVPLQVHRRLIEAAATPEEADS